MPAINFPATPTVNQQFTVGSITYTWDGEKWLAGVSAGATGATGVSGLTGATGAQGATGVQANLTAVTSSVIPAANVTYDLGTSGLRWRDLYLSGNSLYLGGATITATGNAIVLPQGSTIGGNVIGTGSSSVTVGNTAPESPTSGSIWFNSNTGELLVYYDDGDSFQWIQPIGSAGAATVLVSNAQPANVSIGTLWLNSDTGRLLAYYSDGVQPYWIQPVGAAGPTGATGVAGTAGATGATGAGSFAFANSAPASPVVGARWLNSDSMIEYIYVNDGTSTQWVQPTNLSQTGATGATGPVAGSSGQIIYNSANVAAGSANLTFDGTTVTMAANPVLSAGTANGVLYLNGSKAATSGNTLIYDGSALTSSGGNPSAYFKIGSTAPLFAMGWADNTIYHRIKSAGGANDGIQIQLKNDAASLVLSNTPDFFFIINGSEQMRLNSTGLGIGTSSIPSGFKLYASGGSVLMDNNYVFRQKDTLGNNTSVLSLNSSNKLQVGSGQHSGGMEITTGNASMLFSNFDGANTITRMTLDSSGNLGLGVTPSAWFNTVKAFQFGAGGLLDGRTNDAAQATLGAGYYLDSSATYRYISTTGATRFVQVNGAYLWFTAPSGTAGNAITFTQAMTLDASGNLLVGGTTAYGKLTIGTGAGGGNYQAANTIDLAFGASSNRTISFLSDGNSTGTDGVIGAWNTVYNHQNSKIVFDKNAGNTGQLLFFTQGGTGITERVRIDHNGRLGINSNNPVTDRVRIQSVDTDTNGLAVIGINSSAGVSSYNHISLTGATPNNVGTHRGINFVKIQSNTETIYGLSSDITGTYSPQYGFYSKINKNLGAYTNGFCFYADLTTNSSGGTAYFYFANDIDASATRFYVLKNGGIGNYSANNANLSDRREKTNFAPAKSYLDTICAIPVQTFNYIDQSEDDPGSTLGVVAQDVQAVAPELVMESNWGTEDNPKMRLSIYQTDLQYALMKCIQEQQAMINELKAEVAALKGN